MALGSPLRVHSRSGSSEDVRPPACSQVASGDLIIRKCPVKSTLLFTQLASVAGLAAALVTLPTVGPAQAYDIDILHNTNPPPQSEALLTYIDSRRPGTMILVGFDAADIGEGVGDGRNEAVGVSFTFDPPEQVSAAILTIELTKGASGSESDNVNFADNASPWGEGSFAYANELIRPLEAGVRHTIHVDLKHVPGRFGEGNVYDLSDLLLDGTLDVAFTDDSIVHSMRLQIQTTPLPTVSELMDLVRAADLHHGIENALLAKLRAADDALDRGDEGDARDAIESFLSHVRAQRGKKIPRADADEFSAMAREILDGLREESESSDDALAEGDDSGEADTNNGVALSPSAPNPFSQSTAIRFEMLREQPAEVAIFDVSGRRLRTIRSGMLPTGQHVVTWDGRNDAGTLVAAGTYFVRLRSNGRVETDRVVLLRR